MIKEKFCQNRDLDTSTAIHNMMRNFSAEVYTACRRRYYLEGLLDQEVSLRLYGRGWSQDKMFGKYAGGLIQRDTALNGVYNFTRINLHMQPYISMHQRVVECALAGGFMMMWLYTQPWFLDFSVFGTHMRELFQVHPFNLSVAVWVGFLALFGIASDNGVVVATYLDQAFGRRKPDSIAEIREATVAGAMRRCRPALMTAATTILALIPVLTSTGRGAGVMVPMAIPSFGGMAIALITLFVVPVLYCFNKEMKFKMG